MNEINTCSCCKEIWANEKLKNIPLGKNNLWLCPDCFEVWMECNESKVISPISPQPKTEWISVSERLPTKEEYIANNGLFIVTDGNRTYAEYLDVYDSKCFGEPTMSGFRVDRCVIAWQPLPEPYKVESGE